MNVTFPNLPALDGRLGRARQVQWGTALGQTVEDDRRDDLNEIDHSIKYQTNTKLQT